MSTFTLYILLVVLPSIGIQLNCLNSFLVIGFIVCCICFLFSGTIAEGFNCDDDEKKSEEIRKSFAKWRNGFLIAFTVSFIIVCVVPDEKQILMVAGAYTATHSKELAKLPDNAFKAANTYLEKMISDVTEKETNKLIGENK